MPELVQPTPDELKRLLFGAVRAYMAEAPRIGGEKSLELAVSARLAIQLARTPEAVAWEQHGVTVDSEYFQEGLEGGQKGEDGEAERLNGNPRAGNGKPMRPDLIVHKRGESGSQWNWLVCEVKLHTRKRRKATPSDLAKLNRCITRFGYGLAVWLSLPRSTTCDQAVYFSECSDDAADDFGQPQPIP